MPDWLRSSRRFGWTATAICIGLLALTLPMRDGALRWLVLGTILVLYAVVMWRLPPREPPPR